MNVRKIIEEEINKLLEKEDAPPISIAGDKEMDFADDEAGVIKAPAAKEKIFQNKSANSRNCKREGQILPNTVGIKCVYVDPNAPESGFEFELIEGFQWVDGKDVNNIGVKTSDPALIKKYSAPRVPRIKFSNDIMKLQMEINKWLASSPNNKSEMKRLSSNVRTVRGILRGDIGGEDGMWGPNTARAVFIIQSSEKGAPQKQLSPKIMPKQSDIIALTDFLKKINQSSDKTGQGEVTPVAQPSVSPTEPVPSAAAPGPEKQGTINTPFKSGEELTQYVQDLVAQGKRDMLKGQKLYYMDGADKYVIPFDENGKMTSPTKIGNLTPQPPRFTGAGEGRLGPLQESKSLRGMILKEILAALK